MLKEWKMATERVGDMTLENLPDEQEPDSGLSVEEITENLRRHRPTLPPGSPSNQELLREDRDR
jgi:hypothetical protein